MWSVSSWAESQIRHPAKGDDNPYERLLVTDKTGRAHAVDVIINLEELVKQHNDDSRLLRYVDEDARVVIYFTQNSTGDMFTSMQTITRGELSSRSSLFNRMGW